MQYVIWVQQHALTVVQDCGNETPTTQHLSVSLSFYHSLDMVSQRELDLHRKLRGKTERNATCKIKQSSEESGVFLLLYLWVLWRKHRCEEC